MKTSTIGALGPRACCVGSLRARVRRRRAPSAQLALAGPTRRRSPHDQPTTAPASRHEPRDGRAASSSALPTVRATTGDARRAARPSPKPSSKPGSKPSSSARRRRCTPAATLLGPRTTGDRVRDLQARLKQIAGTSATSPARYGAGPPTAVKGFQAKREIPVTGEVDQRTLDRLHAMTRTPTDDELHNIAAGSRRPDRSWTRGACTGRVLCIDKTSRTLRWVVDGKVPLDARRAVRRRRTPRPARASSTST